jgi:glyoxylase-like metal-dependent hydrolase (beta-lactamase superfamily II)
MGSRSDRHPANVVGRWFVDRRCIDCDAVRQIAPDLIGREDRQSVVIRQPATPDEERRMWLAAIACPTRSLRTEPPSRRPRGLYPLELADGVSYLGHNAETSFGANAFLAERPGGNLMVDSPRFTPELVAAVEERGGLAHVLLTHRDDVADAERYAQRFGARVWIHTADRMAAPFATDVVDGEDPVAVTRDCAMVPTPGHTRGSVVYALDDRFLFTGDSLYWSRRRQDLGIHVRQTWYSLDVQLDSLERIAGTVPFSYVLAGHGDRRETTVADMRNRLRRLVARSRVDPDPRHW